MTDEGPEKGDGEILDEEEAVKRLRKLLGEDAELPSAGFGKEPDEEATQTGALADKVSDATAHAATQRDATDLEFEEKLRAVEGRAKSYRASKEKEAGGGKVGASSQRNDAKGLGVGMSLVYTIIGLPLFGAVIGWFIDQGQHTKLWQSVGLLIGGILAIIAVAAMLKRANQDK